MRAAMLAQSIIYILVIVFANIIVAVMGKYGLWVSSFLLIPYDFIMRCYFHEKWKGRQLVIRLGGLVLLAATVTYLINANTQAIAVASMAGFIVANVAAGIFYQATIDQRPIIKVNLSDVVAIVVDSIVFQWVAFGGFDPVVMGGQIAVKILGGLFWFFIIFQVFKFKP